MLVGSTALKHWYADFPREPHDLDYFSKQTMLGADTFWHPGLPEYFDEDIIAPIPLLYTIKVSHAFWDLHGTWDKHMFDILYMQKRGAEYYPILGQTLYNIWTEVHGKKKANLEKSPEEFFNKNVERIYDHDSIHASIAYYDRPLFESILRDGHQVAVDKSKFDALSFEDKLRLVREEVYATALERRVIPSDYQFSPRAAYAYALKQTIISYSKGWFPLFIVLNFQHFTKPDIDYVARHHENNHKLIRLENGND